MTVIESDGDQKPIHPNVGDFHNYWAQILHDYCRNNSGIYMRKYSHLHIYPMFLPNHAKRNFDFTLKKAITFHVNPRILPTSIGRNVGLA